MQVSEVQHSARLLYDSLDRFTKGGHKDVRLTVLCEDTKITWQAGVVAKDYLFKKGAINVHIVDEGPEWEYMLSIRSVYQD